MIEQHVHWNEDIGEWQLRCVAYTGNNMHKQSPQPEKDKDKVGEAIACFIVGTITPIIHWHRHNAYHADTGNSMAHPKGVPLLPDCSYFKMLNYCYLL